MRSSPETYRLTPIYDPDSSNAQATLSDSKLSEKEFDEPPVQPTSSSPRHFFSRGQWWWILLTLGSYLLAALLAVSHHFFLLYLAGKPVAEVGAKSQFWTKTISNAFGKATEEFLVVSTTTALVQTVRLVHYARYLVLLSSIQIS